MISKGFGLVAFFASAKASSVCIQLSCLVCIQSEVHGVWSRLFSGHKGCSLPEASMTSFLPLQNFRLCKAVTVQFNFSQIVLYTAECLDLYWNVFVCEQKGHYSRSVCNWSSNIEIVLTCTAVIRSIELLGNSMTDGLHYQQLQMAETLSLYVGLVALPIIISCRQVALLSLHFNTNDLTVLLRYFLPYSF